MVHLQKDCRVCSTPLTIPNTTTRSEKQNMCRTCYQNIIDTYGTEWLNDKGDNQNLKNYRPKLQLTLDLHDIVTFTDIDRLGFYEISRVIPNEGYAISNDSFQTEHFVKPQEIMLVCPAKERRDIPSNRFNQK